MANTANNVRSPLLPDRHPIRRIRLSCLLNVSPLLADHPPVAPVGDGGECHKASLRSAKTGSPLQDEYATGASGGDG